MKKKILIGAFLLLALMTAIAFVVAAVDSYHYDMDPANGVDTLEGLGATIFLALGGLVILCEMDLFFTVNYFLMKPKTLVKSVFMIIFQLMLSAVFLSEDLAMGLSRYVSDIFEAEILVVAPVFLLYVILRIACMATCFSKKV